MKSKVCPIGTVLSFIPRDHRFIPSFDLKREYQGFIRNGYLIMPFKIKLIPRICTPE